MWSGPAVPQLELTSVKAIQEIHHLQVDQAYWQSAIAAKSTAAVKVSEATCHSLTQLHDHA